MCHLNRSPLVLFHVLCVFYIMYSISFLSPSDNSSVTNVICWLKPTWDKVYLILSSDNGLLPGRHQAIIWTNAGILLIKPLETNISELNRHSYIFIPENAFESAVCEMSAVLSRPQCVNIYPLIKLRLSFHCSGHVRQQNKISPN